MLAALGRVLFNFLSLEEHKTAVLYDAGFADLPATRAKEAGPKENDLRALAHRYRVPGGDENVALTIDRAVAAFREARTSVRNELVHAHPFTVGHDEHETYLPGLNYTEEGGKSWKTVATSPSDLLDLAAKVEEALGPLSEARDAVRQLPLSEL